ncbi:MAG: hypothetical protein AB7O39_00580 [Flavobacteriaceae bacterium]
MKPQSSPYYPQIRRILEGYLVRPRERDGRVMVTDAVRYVRLNYPECRLSEGELSRLVGQGVRAAGFAVEIEPGAAERAF